METSPTKMQLPSDKTWNRSAESEIEKFWDENVKLKFESPSTKPSFAIDTPPPYTSGKPWHVGAAAHYSHIDMIARIARLLGYNVLFPVGMDRNGIPIERYTEKKYNISMKRTERGKFLELAKGALDELEAEMIGILKSLGLSADFQNLYRTDSEKYRALTQSTFIEEWKRGNVYIGTRPSNYCYACGTTIADAEIEYEDLPSKLVYLKFRLSESDTRIIVATTRPELLSACSAIIVNPKDERLNSFIGKNAVIPLYLREVPIIGHESARADFGSGAVMVCSYGDYNDVLLFKELKLKERIIIDQNGRLTKDTGEELTGLPVGEARKKVIALLQEQDVVDKIEDIKHRTPLCERSKTPIELLPLEEYYLKTADLKARLADQLRELTFLTSKHKQILIDWMETALDWPISRRRFYGTEIPVWYCGKCGEPIIPEGGKYYVPWRDPPPAGSKCIACGNSENFIGDIRTFDTWMDSSVSALFVTKYKEDDVLYAKTYPMMLRPQGVEIVRTWLFYSAIRCLSLTDQLPWKNIFIDGHGLDEHGEKMSKSKGNVVDPIPIIEKYGADAFRFWAASESSMGSNYLFSEIKISGAEKFLTKVLNIAKFVKEVGYTDKIAYGELTPTDKWILNELNRLNEKVEEAYRRFDFFAASNMIRDFTWNVFASNYIEMVKNRAYGNNNKEREVKSARYTLSETLRNLMILLSPISPFISDRIWLSLYSKDSIHAREFPHLKVSDSKYLESTERLIEFNSMVWREKRKNKLSLRDKITISIPEELREFKSDLIAMHNINAP